MFKRFLKAFAIASALAILAIFFFFYRSMTATPSFEVINHSNQPVQVSAFWLDQQKEVGTLTVDQSISFNVDAEASMLIVATFDSGERVRGAIGYFTAGSEFQANITENNITITGR